MATPWVLFVKVLLRTCSQTVRRDRDILVTRSRRQHVVYKASRAEGVSVVKKIESDQRTPFFWYPVTQGLVCYMFLTVRDTI